MFAISVCSEGKNEDLLHEVILVVGYFTVLNNDNQVGNQIFFVSISSQLLSFALLLLFCILRKEHNTTTQLGLDPDLSSWSTAH